MNHCAYLCRNLLPGLVLMTLLGLGAPAAQGQEPVLQIDLSKKATVDQPNVKVENYQFVGKPEDGLISLKPYNQALLERPRHVQGTVTTTFDGPAGWYTIAIEYQDEADGTSRYEIRVNDEVVHTWNADSIFATYFATERAEHVKLSPGDQLQVMGQVGGTEYARLRQIRVLPGAAPAGEGESAEIPQRDWSMDLVPLGDYSDYPDPSRLIPAVQGTWGKGRTTVYYFLADRPETFTAYANPPSGNQKAAGSYAFRKVPADAEGPADKLKPAGEYASANVGEPALLEFQIPEAGLYELHTQGGLTEVTHALTRRIGSHAGGEGFFWVPQDTPAIRITGSVNGRYVTNATVKDPNGRIVWQGEIADDGERVIRIPKEQRGQPWYIEYGGVGGTSLNIDAIPPYLSLHRRPLLIPREALGDLAKRDNAAQANAQAKASDAGEARPGIDPAATAAKAPRVTLVNDGQPKAAIIAPADRTSLAGEAAALLQRYIDQISGAELPVYASPSDAPQGAALILVGTPEDFPDVALPSAFNDLNGGGFILRSEQAGGAPRLLVIGRQPEAVQHAAATLLHRLGCRWYFTAQSWHVIPQAETIEVALDELTEPSYLRRTIGYRSTDRGRFAKWAVVNRLGSTFEGAIHHSYESFVPRGLFKEHPEYFAMKDTDGDGIGDTRTPNQPCTTHPDVVEMFKQKAVAAFEANPQLDMLPVSPNDGTTNMCRGERCRALGSYSDCMWLLAHQVAEAVDEKFDGKLISIMAYGRPSPPPTLDMPRDERIVAELATAYLNNVTLDEMLEGWPRYVGLLTVYDYWAIPQWGSNRPGGHFNVQEARDDVPSYHRRGARGLTGEAAGSWGSTGLAIYVATQLMWDINADVDAIVDRYYRECFGAAADAVRDYENRWQDGAEFNDRTLKMALLDLQRALNQAEYLPQKRRVAGLALYMHALKVRRDFAQLGDARQDMSPEQIAEMVEAGDSFLWRFKDVGLFHLSHNIGGVTQNGFPWFTLEQVEALIEQDLEDLADVQAVNLEKQYSEDFVALPASVPGAKVQRAAGDEAAAARRIPARSRVLIQADPKQPVVLHLHRSGNPNAADQVSARLLPHSPGSAKPDAAAVAEQEVMLTEGDSPVAQLSVPEAGIYRIEIVAHSGDYSIESPQRWVLDLSPDAKPQTWLNARDEPWYFYVPSGAKLFELYGGGGNEKPLRIRANDAEGRTVADQTFNRSGKLSVQVPPDMQGSVWNFQMDYFIGLYGNSILGVPPYISASPDLLLVPREALAEQP